VEAGFVGSEDDPAVVQPVPTPLIGLEIGHYKIVRELGRGGMGDVFLAQRADGEFEKQVAIKIVKRGMDTESILRRFMMERQILANLEHPNIARFLDGGTTEDGLPYFVMEYVEGEPITDYCDAHRLNTTERVRLFQKVCAVVQHAHQRLIVHRDLKPSNILVRPDGAPKLLDFGIAKLLNPDWTGETTEETTSAFRLMTPEYASPEQMRGLPITTATDVYSLGVVLYELLSGHRPFRFPSRLPEEIVRVLLTEEPIRPSDAVTRIEEPRATAEASSTPTPESVSRTREGRVEKLRRRLLGDLDNIVLKALRKDLERRYLSVQEFSEDIRRHLEGLPVSARPDTFTYHAGKFIQRHKSSVAMAAIIIIILLSATGITAWQARVAKRERDLAQRRFNEVRKLAHLVVFDYHDSIEKLPGSTPVREKMVKDAIEYLDNLSTEDQNDPTLQQELAAAYQKVGDVQGNPFFANLGDQPGALASYRKALRIREELHHASPMDQRTKFELADSYKSMGDILWSTGENKESLANYHKAFWTFTELANADPKNLKYRSRISNALSGLGHVQEQMGDYSTALETYRRMLTNSETLLAAEPMSVEYRRGIAVADLKVGDTLRNVGDYKGSLDCFEKAAAIFSEIYETDKNNVPIMRSLALALVRIADIQGKLNQGKAAIASHQKTIALQNQISTADPENIQGRFDLAASYAGLSESFRIQNKLDEAVANIRVSLQILIEALKKNPSQSQPRGFLGSGYLILGEILQAKHDLNAALANDLKALAILEAEPVRSARIEDLAICYENIGDIHTARSDWKAAKETYQKSLAVWQELELHGKLSVDHKNTPKEVLEKIAKCDTVLRK
jgi:serine/threonine protein kinase